MTESASIPLLSRRLPVVRTTVLLLAALTAGFALGSPSADAAKRTKKPRIVSISPFATEVLARLGVKPVAIGQVVGDSTKPVPKKFRKVPELALSHPQGPNMEQLATLRPTLVFSSVRWRRGGAAMKGMGARVVYADPVNLAQVYRTVTKIGKKVKRKRQAARLRRTIKRQVRAATRGIRKHPTVMGILGVGKNPRFFLGGSWGGQMIKLAGGRLLTGGARSLSGTQPGFGTISDEVVVAQDPEVIIGVPHGTVSDITAALGYIKDNPKWQTVRAIENNRIYFSTDNRLLQASIDVAKTIRWVREQLARTP